MYNPWLGCKYVRYVNMDLRKLEDDVTITKGVSQKMIQRALSSKLATKLRVKKVAKKRQGKSS